MAYASWSVVFGEQPSAAKWNILGTNDAAFNNGTGLPSAGAVAASVATSETTSSTSYADLATTTDTVTATIGSTGIAIVTINAKYSNNTAFDIAFVSFAISGASTVAAGTYEVSQQMTSNGAISTQDGTAFVVTGLTPGSTTFKMKYKVDAATGTFASRRIAVVPL